MRKLWVLVAKINVKMPVCCKSINPLATIEIGLEHAPFVLLVPHSNMQKTC
jgi:hypothetical protein